MDASRIFYQHASRQPIQERAVFIGTFIDPICPTVRGNGWQRIRTVGYVLAHVYVYPAHMNRPPAIFSWICPLHNTPVMSPVNYFEPRSHWIQAWYPPCMRIRPEPPTSSSSSSSSETGEESRASSPPPDYDYMEGSSVQDRDLEHAFEIVNLAEIAPDVD